MPVATPQPAPPRNTPPPKRSSSTARSAAPAPAPLPLPPPPIATSATSPSLKIPAASSKSSISSTSTAPPSPSPPPPPPPPPIATRSRASAYDAAAASQGSPVVALGDDDSRQITLPFAFPFFGVAYRQLFLNSDGNLTFTAGDTASSGRSVGRMTGGLPRISPLFDDLDPSRSRPRLASASSPIPATSSSLGSASPSSTRASTQTFQVRLYRRWSNPQFSYQDADPSTAVVGIAPGADRGGTTLVSFRNMTPPADQSGAVLERFGNTVDIDVVSVAQKFYETHEDAYDYLVDL